MEWILYIIAGIVALCIVFSIFYSICRKYPWIRLVLAIILGVASYFIWYEWWASLIVWALSFGALLLLTSSMTRRGNKIYCQKCGNDMIDTLEETDDYIKYYCPKCKNKGKIYLTR